MSIPKRRQIRPRGHVFEFRINAEDPVTFAPSPGLIEGLVLPGGPGVRVDTHLYAGYRVPPYYDSLLAKVLVFGQDREEALIRSRRALESMRLDGIKTSIPLHLRILDDADFQAGRVDTHFMERFSASA